MDDKSRPETAPGVVCAPARSSIGGIEAERLARIVECLPDPTFAIDSDSRVVVWNRACELLTGVSKRAMLGQSNHAHGEALFGDRRPTLVDLLDRPSAQTEALYECVKWRGDVLEGDTFSPRARSGQGAYLRAAAFRLFDRSGRRSGGVEIVRDVTDQKPTEQALEDSRQRLVTAQRVAGVGFLDWNLQTNEVFLSEQACELTGFTPEGQTTTPEFVARTVHPDDLACVRENLDLAIAGIKPYDIVHRHVRPDGGIVWVRARAELTRDPTGAPSRLLGTIVDITRRKLIEDALRERETQLSLILNNVSDVIFAVAVEGGGEFRFASVNRRFLEATGLKESEVVGARVSDIIPQPAHALVFDGYREAIRRGEPVHWEEVSRYPAGVKIGHVTVVPVYDAERRCTQLVGMVHDITDRKLAEEQVRRLNEDLRRHTDDLERRVEARTAQLAGRNQELKDFAYTVSHDLKAPLRGIAGYANELVRKHSTGLSERARFCLAQIVSAASNLDRLIEDLLHYSRLDAETPSLADVDLRELVDGILRDRRLMIAEQKTDVIVDIPFPAVTAWQRGLVQVLTNLIDNAIKYSRNATAPRVHIAAAIGDGEWRLTVGDNGIGFDMKYHDRIFGLFNRLVRMEEYEGTGAGLAIVKKVVDKQGGRVWADATPGRGATFFVVLPMPRGGD